MASDAKLVSLVEALKRHIAMVVGNTPYTFCHGIDYKRQIANEILAEKLRELFGDWAIDYIIGGGQLFDEFSPNPYQSFCENDAQAIASDWAASGSDLIIAFLAEQERRKRYQSHEKREESGEECQAK